MEVNHDPHSCIVVNLFGEPCVGKTTAATYIFSCLRMMGVRAELVTEFAKDMVWEGCDKAFHPEGQAYLFGNQLWRILRCQDSVDVIVTDSPLLLNVPYNRSLTLGTAFNSMVANVFLSYNNMSYLIQGSNKYERSGRRHSESELTEIHNQIINSLHTYNVKYKTITGDLSGYHSVVSDIMEVLHEREKSNGEN